MLSPFCFQGSLWWLKSSCGATRPTVIWRDDMLVLTAPPLSNFEAHPACVVSKEGRTARQISCGRGDLVSIEHMVAADSAAWEGEPALPW